MIGNREAINDSHLTSIPQAYSFVIGARGQQMLVIRTGRDAAHLMQMGHQSRNQSRNQQMCNKSRNQQMCNQSRNQKMRNQGRNQQMLVFGTGREAPRLCPMSGGSQSMANQWPINGQSHPSPVGFAVGRRRRGCSTATFVNDGSAQVPALEETVVCA